MSLHGNHYSMLRICSSIGPWSTCYKQNYIEAPCLVAVRKLSRKQKEYYVINDKEKKDGEELIHLIFLLSSLYLTSFFKKNLNELKVSVRQGYVYGPFY